MAADSDDRTPESYIVLGTTRSPGVIPPGGITGHDRPKNWNVKNAKGQQGASMTLDGDNPGKLQITFDLSDEQPEDGSPSDLDLWEDFQKLIESTTPTGGKPTTLPISHPDLVRNHFTSVSNGGVGGMVHDGEGGRRVTATFTEYIPPKPKPVQKAAAKPAQTYATTDEGGRSPPPDDPNAAAKQQLDDLTNQANQP